MKILVLSYEYPPIGGGGGVICQNISEQLVRLGHNITVLTTAFAEKESQASQQGEFTSYTSQNTGQNKHGYGNLTIIRLNARRRKAYASNPIEMLSWIREAKNYLRSRKDNLDYDLCMAHFVLPGGEVARWLKRKAGIPYIVVSHGHDIPWVHPGQMFFFHLGSYWWIKSICRQSSVNFIQTQMMKDNLDKFTGSKRREKNVIIPNGVDGSKFFPDFGMHPDKLRIIFCGRLVSQKDPMTFMKALLMVSSHPVDFEAHIYGDGKFRNRMEGFATKNGLSDRVKFFGKVSEAQMIRAYREAHLMAATSLSEGMSIAALEALACGVYLIATRASGYDDMISENINGEFIAFRDPAGLAARIIRFYEGNFRDGTEIISTGTAPKVLDWKTISREYQRLMEEIVS